MEYFIIEKWRNFTHNVMDNKCKNGQEYATYEAWPQCQRPTIERWHQHRTEGGYEQINASGAQIGPLRIGWRQTGRLKNRHRKIENRIDAGQLLATL